MLLVTMVVLEQSADNYGGAIYVGGYSSLSFLGTSNNTARYGGVISVYDNGVLIFNGIKQLK